MILSIASASPPAFYSEVVALLVASALVAYACHRVGVLPIVSFLVTGAVIGPQALGLVHDETLIEAAAELGVILLLFTIGIEFSLEKLGRIKRLIFLGGGLQVVLVIGSVTGLLALFGVGWRMGLFTGCLVALSSTAIVMKLLMGARDMGSAEGRASLGILIFQDLAVVAMVLLVPMLGQGTGSGWAIALALGKAAGIVALVLLAARRVMPRILEAVARTCSQEIFLLSVVAICFGTAFLTSLAGVSLSLGAFLAGLVVSESRFSQLAFGEILPLQILFSATFFVSVGLLLDIRFLLSNPLLVLGVIAAVLTLKVMTTGVSLRILGYGTGAAASSALLLAQVGEFSFVLERTGRGMGLYPAGLEVGGPETFIAATVALMIATPFLYRLGDALRKPGGRPTVEAVPSEVAEMRDEVHQELRDHVIIAGFGRVSRWIARVLDESAIPYLILTLSPDGAREAERGELRVLRGNYTRQHELTLAGLRSARLLVVADDDLETTKRVVAAARALNPDISIVVGIRHATEVQELREAGAAEVVSEEQEGLARLLTRVLEAYEANADDIRRKEERVRWLASVNPKLRDRGRTSVEADGLVDTEKSIALRSRQRESDRCSHTDMAVRVTPGTSGCAECLETGDEWVHLRICMTCGHVGCCDASANRHASKHFQASGHPIVKSLEPGEGWVWCYLDQSYL